MMKLALISLIVLCAFFAGAFWKSRDCVPSQELSKLRERLDRFDDVIAHSERWPKTVADAEQLLNNFKAMLSKVPVWAEADLKSVLNRQRWAIQVLWTLRANENPQDSDLDELEEHYRSLVAAMPDDLLLVDLSKTLATKTEATHAQAVHHRNEAAVARAELLLARRQEAPRGDLELVSSQLADLVADPQYLTQALSLKEKVQRQITINGSHVTGIQLQEQLPRIRAISEQSLQRAAMARLLARVRKGVPDIATLAFGCNFRGFNFARDDRRPSKPPQRPVPPKMVSALQMS